MRLNVYAEELTDRVEIISKEIEGQKFTGLRLYLYLPVTLPERTDWAIDGMGNNVRGPFMHGPNDDDSSAVTFWGKRDLRAVLRIMLAKLDEHYDGSAPTYTCQHCGVASLKDEWGPGHVTCPKCHKVALSAAERAT